MIRVLLFALLFAVPAAADDVFMNNTTSESDMCVISVTGQTASTPSAVAHANWSPITYNCAAGTYLPADGIECATCTAGNYCIGGNYTYNETTTQGLTPCTANYTSSAGASTCVPMTYNINYVLNGGNALPSGYTQLEYLQSAGINSYIETGDSITGNMYFEISFADVVAGSGSGFTLIGNYTIGIQYYDPYGWILRLPNILLYHTFAIDEPVTDTLYITPTSIKSQNFTWYPRSDTNTPQDKMVIFRVQSGKLYYAKVWDGNVLLRNMIPARRDSDNIAGMYDFVSDAFFSSAGSSAFVAGPVIGTTVESYTYGTGATISARPTRSHSSFVGWCTDAGLTSCAATQTIGTTATGDKTFYAKYLCDTGYSTNVSNTACSANTITVNWDNGAGGATQNTCTYGGDLTTPTTAPTKRGHVFTGWTFNVN